MKDQPDTHAPSPPPEPGLKWLDAFTPERWMPRTLMARASMTIVVPLILVQVLSTYIFYDNHWDALSRRLAGSLAGDIASIAAYVTDFPTPEHRAWAIRNAQETMLLDIRITEGEVLQGPNVITADRDFGDPLEDVLWETLQRPFRVDLSSFRTERLTWISGTPVGAVSIHVQLPSGVLHILAPRARLFSSTTYVFVIWMVGSSMLLFGVAAVYLRNQVQTVRRLAKAADDFGKGREVPDFTPEGAFEVRQVARAFNIMRNRITRQMAQRTEMLAGVSHDLRTPLTRMKLQMEMMNRCTAEDIADLKDDVGEMERMLDAYLAFARGDGAEEAKPTDVGGLLETVTGRFRREGRNITLGTENLPELMPLKPIALERCLTNLIANAVRYGKTVVVNASRAGRFIDIHVDDDGPGIAPEHREEVFRAFHRLEPSRNPKTGGVGLGLTIARDIVRGMGGDIELIDSPIGGLRASLKIPL